MKIAISGKGGVGKTTLAGVLARILAERGFSVLAIDADPNSNLALTLGLTPGEAEAITPLAENAELVEEKTGVRPDEGSPVFRLSFRVDDVIDRFGVKTPSGVGLVVMGAVRSSGQGCMCPANALVRAVLRHILTKRDEAVIVDLEAGVEHFGRGTAEFVDAMLVVTEATVKSLETVKKVVRLSKGLGINVVFVVGNKVNDKSDEVAIRKFCDANKIPLLRVIPYDENVKKSDTQGISLDRNSEGFRAIQHLVDDLFDLVKT